MEKTGEARTDPTPIATPTKLIDGILEAEYLEPKGIAAIRL